MTTDIHALSSYDHPPEDGIPLDCIQVLAYECNITVAPSSAHVPELRAAIKRWLELHGVRVERPLPEAGTVEWYRDRIEWARAALAGELSIAYDSAVIEETLRKALED